MAQSYSVEPERIISGPASVPEATERKAVNWPHVWAYTGLSFGLTWLIDLLIYLNGGLTNPAARLLIIGTLLFGILLNITVIGKMATM